MERQDRQLCGGAVVRTAVIVVLSIGAASPAADQAHSVYSVCFTPDGKQLLSGGASRRIQLWNVATGREIRSFEHPGWMQSVAVSPDGRRGLTGTRIRTGRRLRSGNSRRVWNPRIDRRPDGIEVRCSEFVALFNIAVAIVFLAMAMAMFGAFNLDFTRLQTRISTGGPRRTGLLPALFLVLVAIGGYALFFAEPGQLDKLRGDALATLGYFANWRFAFSGDSYFEQFALPSPLRHTWSLAIEEQWYLVWPLLVVLLLSWRRGSLRALLGLAVVMTVGSALLMALLHDPRADPSRVYYGTDTRAHSLLVGAVLAMLLLRGGAIRGVAQGLLQGESAFLESIGKRLTLEALHDQKVGAVFFANVVESANVGMIQAGDGPRLTLEALLEVRIVGEVRG